MKNQVKEYYGQILQNSTDLKTNACCCSSNDMTSEIKDIVKEIDNEVIEKFYGCGSPIPPLLKDCTVLDLGCGSGRDVYIVSKLVGEKGQAIGIDMTDEQLQTANKHVESQTKRYAYKKPNVVFKKAYIENLNDAGIEDNSIDVVISNCVINLSPDKISVFKEIFRVLKPGGELFFSDVFSDRRIPEDLANDPVLYGECLSGAMYTEDFRRMLQSIGCNEYRTVKSSAITIENIELEKKIGMINFYSLTIRAFKLDDIEDLCENYGQVATYKGTIPENFHYFELDNHHKFFTGKPMLICGNTASMIQKTRYSSHFEVVGNRLTHFGFFDCSEKSVIPSENAASGSCC